VKERLTRGKDENQKVPIPHKMSTKKIEIKKKEQNPLPIME